MTGTLAMRLLGLPRVAKRTLALAADALFCILTVAVAYLLRLDRFVFPEATQWLSYAVALAFALPLFTIFGLYSTIFRFVGWNSFLNLIWAFLLYGGAYAFVFTIIGVPGVPRTTGIIEPILLFMAISGSRAMVRFFLGDRYQAIRSRQRRRRVLIYGAGAAGRQLAAVIDSSHEMELVGFIDDDVALAAQTLNGKPVHRATRLDALITQDDIAEVLLAIPSVTQQRRNEIVERLRHNNITIRTLPAMLDLAHGKVSANDLHEIDIEDLLGRDSIPPDRGLLTRKISGSIILVTGAGGSIGSELCRQILAQEPSLLLLVEVSEFNLYTIHQELLLCRGQGEIATEFIPLLASVHDARRMEEIISTWRPAAIYHAAAYKHVPLVEQNLIEGVRNNVMGTQIVARLAQQYNVQDFVLISTDKAVRPTSVMGTTKRLAELVVKGLSARGDKTSYSIVRFGNVLGSSGSVVPLFRRQIRSGGPVTITDERITRYFMTIPEAAQLVIQAGAMADNGEVFVLDMGKPVKIVDLARRMIELSGLTIRDAENPDGEIELQIVGLRPGEKLYEELLMADNPEPTAHERIFKVDEGPIDWDALNQILDALCSAAANGDTPTARAVLAKAVPEWTSTSIDVDWVERATRQNEIV